MAGGQQGGHWAGSNWEGSRQAIQGLPTRRPHAKLGLTSHSRVSNTHFLHGPPPSVRTHCPPSPATDQVGRGHTPRGGGRVGERASVLGREEGSEAGGSEAPN